MIQNTHTTEWTCDRCGVSQTVTISTNESFWTLPEPPEEWGWDHRRPDLPTMCPACLDGLHVLLAEARQREDDYLGRARSET